MYTYLSFIDKYGKRAEDFHFIQAPNLLFLYARDLDIDPTDIVIYLYMDIFPEDYFHSYSNISEDLNLHPNTLKNHVRKLEDKHYLIRIRTSGSANIFDFTGLRNKIKALAINIDSPNQNSYSPSTKIARSEDQNLYTNKQNNKKKNPFEDRINQLKQLRDRNDV